MSPYLGPPSPLPKQLLKGIWQEASRIPAQSFRRQGPVLPELTRPNSLNSCIFSQYLDSWFANIIATDPEHQRKGYATALTKAVCQRV